MEKVKAFFDFLDTKEGKYVVIEVFDTFEAARIRLAEIAANGDPVLGATFHGEKEVESWKVEYGTAKIFGKEVKHVSLKQLF